MFKSFGHIEKQCNTLGNVFREIYAHLNSLEVIKYTHKTFMHNSYLKPSLLELDII